MDRQLMKPTFRRSMTFEIYERVHSVHRSIVHSGTGPIGYCTEKTHFLVSEKPISLFDLRFPRIVVDTTRSVCPRTLGQMRKGAVSHVDCPARNDPRTYYYYCSCAGNPERNDVGIRCRSNCRSSSKEVLRTSYRCL